MFQTRSTPALKSVLFRLLIPVSIAAAFILWRFQVFNLTHPAYFGEHDPIYLLGQVGEELFRGAVAKEFMSGTQLPVWAYRPDNYAGGFYVIVTLLPFFFKIFGFKILALKALGIIITCLTLLTWYGILAKYLNQRTALFFSLFYTFAPFRYITHSSLVLGDHAETCLLSALTVLLFFRVRELPPARRKLSYAALGLLAGFSLWFAYIYAITLAALLVFLAINRWWNFFSRRGVLLCMAGFLLGFSFWLAFNFHSNFSGMFVRGKALWQIFKIQNLWAPFFSHTEFFLYRLWEDMEMPDLFHPPYNLNLSIYVALTSVIMLAAMAEIILKKPQERRLLFAGPAGFSLIYVSVFLMLQQMSDVVGMRFLVPLLPFGVVLISWKMAALSESRPWTALLAAVVILVPAILCTTQRFDARLAGEYLERKGYSIQPLGFLPLTKPEIEAVLKRNFSEVPRADKTGYVKAYVRSLALEGNNAAREISSAALAVPEEYRNFFAYFAGREIMLRNGDPAAAVKLIAPLHIMDHGLFEQASRGIFGATIQLGFSHSELEEFKKDIPPDLIHKLEASEGFAFSKKHFSRHSSADEFFGMADKETKDYPPLKRERFIRGIGRYLYRTWSMDPKYSSVQPRDFMAFPEEMKQDLFRGAAQQMLRKHVVYASSPVLWQWNSFYLGLEDEESRKLLKQGLVFALSRQKLPASSLPLGKMAGLRHFNFEEAVAGLSGESA